MSVSDLPQGIQKVLASLQRGFRDLSLPALVETFAQEATAFFPIEHRCEALLDRDQVQEAFAKVLATIRERAEQGLILDFCPVHFYQAGELAFLVAELREKQGNRWTPTGRRTLVLQQQQDVWRIVHLHASNYPEP